MWMNEFEAAPGNATAEAPGTRPDARLDARDETRQRVALSGHMQRAVRGPLAALRAVLEGQRHAAAYVDRALGELARVEHAVDDLYRWSAPHPLRYTSCSLAELASSVRSGLDDNERERLWINLEQGSLTLRTDGTLLVATLRRFVRASLARTTTEILLHAHTDGDSVTIAVVDDPPQVDVEHDGEEHVDLPLLLGQRDVARLGGTCTVHTTTPRHRCIVLRFPQQSSSSRPCDTEVTR
jgi:hypothetical protein